VFPGGRAERSRAAEPSGPLKNALRGVDPFPMPRIQHRRPRRLGSGVVSLPLWLRLVITAPFVFLLAGLLQSFVHFALDREPSAAFSLILLGLVGRAAWVLLPSVWHSSAEWQRDEQVARLLERQLKASLDETVHIHPGLAPSQHAPQDKCAD
jgi:hypothetical protein